MEEAEGSETEVLRARGLEPVGKGWASGAEGCGEPEDTGGPGLNPKGLGPGKGLGLLVGVLGLGPKPLGYPREGAGWYARRYSRRGRAESKGPSIEIEHLPISRSNEVRLSPPCMRVALQAGSRWSKDNLGRVRSTGGSEAKEKVERGANSRQGPQQVSQEEQGQ